MSNEELVVLAKKGNNKALEDLYYNNMGLIKKICRRYSYITYSTHDSEAVTTLEDLQQVAYFGIVEAVKNYDSTLNNVFITYAYSWIKQAVSIYIQNCGQQVSVPIYMQQRIYRYNRCNGYYLSKYNREATDSELCYYIEINPMQLDSLKKYMGVLRVTSLDSPINEEDKESTIGETIEDNTVNVEQSVIEKIDNAQLQQEVIEVISGVLKSKVMKDVIYLRYFQGLTLQASGDRLGIKVDQVRNTEAKALRILRNNSRTKHIAINNGFLVPKDINKQIYRELENHAIG